LSQTKHIEQFIEEALGSCIIDVRTPQEFEQGRIPGAINIPLFDDEERAIVGTLYKQEGKQQAILKGLEIVGPKMANIVRLAQSASKDNTVFIHCWRGGMRSGSVAWLLELYGMNVVVLKGGYKAFRNYVLNSFDRPIEIMILGGKTGSGKTHVLHQLKQKGAQIIDLEKLANHKGSAFGAIGEEPQPSQEQFENELALQLNTLLLSKKVWLEDESKLIGKKCIPPALWSRMRVAPVIYIDVSFEKRVKNLIDDYGKFPKEQLQESILKISKRLGPEQTKISIEALNNNDLKTVCEICLKYYDKTYEHGLHDREKLIMEELDFGSLDFDIIADKLINTYK